MHPYLIGVLLLNKHKFLPQLNFAENEDVSMLHLHVLTFGVTRSYET